MGTETDTKVTPLCLLPPDEVAKVLHRVSILFGLSKSTNEAERENALAAAFTIIRKYDIEAAKVAALAAGEHLSELLTSRLSVIARLLGRYGRVPRYITPIMSAIAETQHCAVNGFSVEDEEVGKDGKVRKVTATEFLVYGTADDTQRVCDLFTFVLAQLADMVKHYGGDGRKRHSFRLGAALRLHERIRAAAAQADAMCKEDAKDDDAGSGLALGPGEALTSTALALLDKRRKAAEEARDADAQGAEHETADLTPNDDSAFTDGYLAAGSIQIMIRTALPEESSPPAKLRALPGGRA